MKESDGDDEGGNRNEEVLCSVVENQKRKRMKYDNA